jgi:hypothetical protein
MMKPLVMKSLRQITAPVSVVLFGIVAIASAQPTQQQVFQSINDNVSSSAEWTEAVPYLLVLAGLVIMGALINYHLKHRVVVRKANNPAKLSREIRRRISLRPVELKQLKLMAQEQEVQNPLTLILCPSLLGKAIRTSKAKVDREVVKEMVGKLKQGLSEKH